MNESMETAVPKVLRKHGWRVTKPRSDGDDEYEHPNHPGHGIRIDNRGGWWHALCGAPTWASVIHANMEKYATGHPIEHVAHGRPDLALDEHLTKFHAQGGTGSMLILMRGYRARARARQPSGCQAIR